MQYKNDLNIEYKVPVMRRWYAIQELIGAILAALLVAIPFAIYFFYLMPDMVDTVQHINNAGK